MNETDLELEAKATAAKKTLHRIQAKQDKRRQAACEHDWDLRWPSEDQGNRHGPWYECDKCQLSVGDDTWRKTYQEEHTRKTDLVVLRGQEVSLVLALDAGRRVKMKQQLRDCRAKIAELEEQDANV